MEEFSAFLPRNISSFIPITFESLIDKFPCATQPLALEVYIISPDYFDPNEIRNAILLHGLKSPGIFQYMAPLENEHDSFREVHLSLVYV